MLPPVQCTNLVSLFVTCFLQVYTYVLRPLSAGGLAGPSQQQQCAGMPNSSGSSSTPPAAAAGSVRGSGTAASGNLGAAAAAAQQVVGYELQLVMEYCPLVSNNVK
jgi:hypothetical protein